MRITKSVLSHSIQALAEGTLVALIVVGLVAGTAFAGRGGGGSPKGGGGSTSLAWVLVTDVNGNGSPNWGDTITFNVQTTATDSPYVSVKCYQNGTLVYGADAGFYESYPWPGARNMPLYSPLWTGGAADCTATVNTKLAKISFSVGS